MKPREIKIEGTYDWVNDSFNLRGKVERHATLSDCYGDGATSRRTILWVNERPHLMKKGVGEKEIKVVSVIN